MSGKQRKLKNFLVTPRFQLKFSLYYVVSGLAFFGVIMAIAYWKLTQVRELMSQSTLINFQTQTHINDLMLQIFQYTLAGFVVYIIASSVFALIMSHRVAGPVVAIKGFIEQLKQGNYDYRRSLRPRDELNEIMDALQELAPILKERAKSRSELPESSE